MMDINTDIIEKVLFEKFPDLPLWKIDNIIEEMEHLQDEYDASFEDFVDRVL